MPRRAAAPSHSVNAAHGAPARGRRPRGDASRAGAARTAHSPRAAAGGRPRVSDRDYELLASFRRTLRRFMHFSEEAAREVGLTPQQHQALLAIKGSGRREAMTIGELADALQVRHHSAVGLVNRLVDQALARRVPGADDRRQVLLALAPRGLELLEELAATHRHELRRVGPELRTLLAHLNDESEPS